MGWLVSAGWFFCSTWASAEASADGLKQLGFDLAFLSLFREPFQWDSLISLYGGSGLQEQMSQGDKSLCASTY